jgi:hypothetical protein
MAYGIEAKIRESHGLKFERPIDVEGPSSKDEDNVIDL